MSFTEKKTSGESIAPYETRTIAVSDSYPHHCVLQNGSMGKMCCGNCSVGENSLAKFEGYPAVIGIINMKLTNKFI